PVAVVDAAQVGGRVHLGAHLVGVQLHHVVAEGPHPPRVLGQLGELPLLGGDGDAAGAFELAVDAVPLHGLGDAVQVLVAQPLQFGDLVGPPVHAVGVAVG